MGKDKWKELFLPKNRKMQSNILLAFLVGILLLTVGRGFSEAESESERTPPKAAEGVSVDRETEGRMAEILSGVEGAGEVDVMLTFCQKEEKNIARDEVREEKGDGLRTEQTAVLLEDEDGGLQPLVLTEYAPVVEGVVITAQGADEPAVAAALHQAAQALLDVPAHKVAVLKMK